MPEAKEDECTGFVDFVIEEEDHHKRNRADARKHKSRRLFHKKPDPFQRNMLTSK